jgi:hypothetical protein
MSNNNYEDDDDHNLKGTTTTSHKGMTMMATRARTCGYNMKAARGQ